jgi:hypothetical protein
MISAELPASGIKGCFQAGHSRHHEDTLAACNTYGRVSSRSSGVSDILAKRKEILEMMRRLKAEFPENANMVTWKKFANDSAISRPNEINAFFTPFSKETF